MLKSIFYMTNYIPIYLNFFMMMMMILPTKNNKLNPINFMMLLIIITLIISLKMNISLNSWISYILFLIMIGGLMIIFLYITSLSNNELFLFNYKIILLNFFKFIILIILMMLIMMIYNFQFFYLNNYFNNFNMNHYNLKINFIEMYSIYHNMISLFIMNYLFFSMICIMNICYKFKSPLRQLYFYE